MAPAKRLLSQVEPIKSVDRQRKHKTTGTSCMNRVKKKNEPAITHHMLINWTGYRFFVIGLRAGGYYIVIPRYTSNIDMYLGRRPSDKE
jgi:CTP-dependent riboflavin kinase